MILVAEDDASDLWLVTQALQATEFPTRLEVSRDGDEAINYLLGREEFGDRERHPVPNLLLLDLKMPRVNGMDVLRWVRRSVDYCCLPVVMLSGSVVQEDIDQAYRNGANAFFTKPSGFHALKHLMHHIVGFWGLAQVSRGGVPICAP